MSNDTVVRARINSDIKIEAMEALEAMGLTISDAIRFCCCELRKRSSCHLLSKCLMLPRPKPWKNWRMAEVCAIAVSRKRLRDLGI